MFAVSVKLRQKAEEDSTIEILRQFCFLVIVLLNYKF